MNEKLKAIIEKAATDLMSLAKESETELLDAWNQAEQEAQDNEQKPKFRLGFSITLDLDANQQDNALTWSIRRTRTTSSSIPDPNQMELDGTQMTITTGDESVSITGADLKKAVKAVRNARKN